MIKKTFGSIITAQPKPADYEKSAGTLARLIYSKITSGQYGLNRSMEDSNEYPSNDRVNATTIAVSIKPADLSAEDAEDLLAVSRSFVANNMNSDKLSIETVKQVLALDKDDKNLFSDVNIVLGYNYEGDEEGTPIMLMSKVDDVVKNIQDLNATISITNYETPESFLSAYSDEKNTALAYGNVGEFTFA